MRKSSRAAIISNHPWYRQLMAKSLREHGVKVVEANTSSQLRAGKVDLAILDLDHLAGDSMAQLRQLAAHRPELYTVALGSALRLAAAVDGRADAEIDTSRPDGAALAAALARRAGKPPSDRARRPWSELTPRQRDVLRWLAGGLDNQAIGDHLKIGERAVKAHVSALLERFGFANRTELALHAYRAGLRPPGRHAANGSR